MSNNRLIQYDFARALCVLWIVGYWHFHDYLPLSYKLSSESQVVCETITTIVLACFTFLSGFFLKKYRFNSLADIKQFYIKRVKRFYVLFFISSCCLFAMNWMNFKTFLANILGLGMFYVPCKTLWYLSMLMSFYVITPILNWNFSAKWKRISAFACPLILCYILAKFHFCDIRMIMYLPFYVLGLFIKEQNEIYNLWTMLLCLFALALMSYFHIQSFLAGYAYMTIGLFFILSFCHICNFDILRKPISFIAFGSMCSYLFHREIFETFKTACYDQNENGIPLTIGITSLIVVFIGAYYIQVYYDKLIKRIEKHV